MLLHQLAELDVSKNTVLTTLSCYSNQLMELDVSKNTALMYLDCSGNHLMELDVIENTSLTSLSCYYNHLSSLDVSKNTALTYLISYSQSVYVLKLTKQSDDLYYLNLKDCVSCDLSRVSNVVDSNSADYDAEAGIAEFNYLPSWAVSYNYDTQYNSSSDSRYMSVYLYAAPEPSIVTSYQNDIEVIHSGNVN